MPPVELIDPKAKLAQNTLSGPELKRSDPLQESLSGQNYNDAKASLKPNDLALQSSSENEAANNNAETVDPEQDAALENSVLVAGIQPDMIAGNFIARQWYNGRLGGPETGDQGDLVLPYDDTTSQEADIQRVQLYGNYASGNIDWAELEKQDPTGATDISALVDQFLGVASAQGVIYAHSGGGAASMAGLKRMLELHGADHYRALKIRTIQVQGLEAVITAEQVYSLGEGFAEVGVKLVVDNTIAGPESSADQAGSETWSNLIAPGISEGGETPYVSHVFTGLKTGDAHANMVPALYDNDKMPERTPR